MALDVMVIIIIIIIIMSFFLSAMVSIFLSNSDLNLKPYWECYGYIYKLKLSTNNI
jgi:hypothetical protein